MSEIEQVRGRHRWDPLVNAEQPLTNGQQPSLVDVGEADETDTATRPTEGSSAPPL